MFMWEFTALARKLFVLVISQLAKRSFIQSFAASLVLGLFLIATAASSPFVSPDADFLEMFSLIALTFTQLGVMGMRVFVIEKDTFMLTLIVWVLILLNVFTMVIAATALVSHYLKSGLLLMLSTSAAPITSRCCCCFQYCPRFCTIYTCFPCAVPSMSPRPVPEERQYPYACIGTSVALVGTWCTLTCFGTGVLGDDGVCGAIRTCDCTGRPDPRDVRAKRRAAAAEATARAAGGGRPAARSRPKAGGAQTPEGASDDDDKDGFASPMGVSSPSSPGAVSVTASLAAAPPTPGAADDPPADGPITALVLPNRAVSLMLSRLVLADGSLGLLYETDRRSFKACPVLPPEDRLPHLWPVPRRRQARIRLEEATREAALRRRLEQTQGRRRPAAGETAGEEGAAEADDDEHRAEAALSRAGARAAAEGAASGDDAVRPTLVSPEAVAVGLERSGGPSDAGSPASGGETSAGGMDTEPDSDGAGSGGFAPGESDATSGSRSSRRRSGAASGGSAGPASPGGWTSPDEEDADSPAWRTDNEASTGEEEEEADDDYDDDVHEWDDDGDMSPGGGEDIADELQRLEQQLAMFGDEDEE